MGGTWSDIINDGIIGFFDLQITDSKATAVIAASINSICVLIQCSIAFEAIRKMRKKSGITFSLKFCFVAAFISSLIMTVSQIVFDLFFLFPAQIDTALAICMQVVLIL